MPDDFPLKLSVNISEWYKQGDNNVAETYAAIVALKYLFNTGHGDKKIDVKTDSGSLIVGLGKENKDERHELNANVATNHFITHQWWEFSYSLHTRIEA
ncbi:unnamed protein product, partial [Mesorhabditis belari]|uniref:Uncharacterized protein n=1 Tax=Mesorhabditis belari TaxID=2138241 RepID=A0AAF3FLG2_9BILA